MSTRGCIARPNAEGGWEGRYHHFDSYPEGLGKTLFSLYHGHFQGDVRSMQKFLIDDHPAGWSTINETDFNLSPGFDEYPVNRGNQPSCYCHGDRHECASMITCGGSDQHGDHCDGSSCDPLWIEWAYVLGPEGMAIYCTWEGEELVYRHHLLTSVAWSDTPDWEAITQMSYGEESN